VATFDLICAIELAYDRSKDEVTWLAEITNTIAPTFGDGAATSFIFDLSDENVRLGTTSSTGRGSYKREHYERQHEFGRKLGPINRAYECDMYTLLSRAVGAEEAKQSMVAAGMTGEDAIGLRANATPKSGIILTTQVKAGHRLRNRDLWTRFAAHLGAALRLRRMKPEPLPDTAPAELSPNGHIEHGTGEAIAAQASLGRAARKLGVSGRVALVRAFKEINRS
jgi:hypothetical protein